MLERSWLLWTDRLVLYPSADEVRALAGNLGPVELVRVRQTSEEIPSLPHVLEQRPFLTSCVELQQDEDQLFRGLHATTRQLINRSRRMGDDLQVDWDTPRARRDFQDLYGRISARKGLPRIGGRRFRQYQAIANLSALYHRGRMMSGHLLARDESVGRVRLMYSVTVPPEGDPDHVRAAGLSNRYLHWSELLRYRADGFRLYDFGGIGSGEGPLATFKLSFGGVAVQEYDYLLASGAARAVYRAAVSLSRTRRKVVAGVARRRSRSTADAGAAAQVPG